MSSKYKDFNKQWLKNKRHEEGITMLPDGVLYKVIESGTGAQPGPRSVITCHYTGRLIDGSEFDSSVGDCPLAIRVSDVIEGWIVALTHMHVGDKWEVYIPADLGYGRMAQPGIPAYSTLIFEIELISVA